MNKLQEMVVEYFSDEVYDYDWVDLPVIGKQVRDAFGEELFSDEYINNALLEAKKGGANYTSRNVGGLISWVNPDDIEDDDDEDEWEDEYENDPDSRITVTRVSQNHVRINVRL